MLVSKIDYNMLSEIMAMKEVIRESVEAVLDEKITASHLSTDVYKLLDLLDKLENDWKGTPPEDDIAMPAAQAPPVAQQAQVEQPPVAEVKVEEPPAEQAQSEPPAEQVQTEQAPAEDE